MSNEQEGSVEESKVICICGHRPAGHYYIAPGYCMMSGCNCSKYEPIHNLETKEGDFKESTCQCKWCIQNEKEFGSLRKIEEDRSKIYGDPFLSHQAIGLVWEGIFRNRYHNIACREDVFAQEVGKLFPADLVAEMLAGFKLTRFARPTYHQDSIDDCKVYLSFSERFRAPNK